MQADWSHVEHGDGGVAVRERRQLRAKGRGYSGIVELRSDVSPPHHMGKPQRIEKHVREVIGRRGDEQFTGVLDAPGLELGQGETAHGAG